MLKKTKTKWEKTARGARLVRSEVLGTTTKTKRGANWKRADQRKGSAKTERAARKMVEAPDLSDPVEQARSAAAQTRVHTTKRSQASHPALTPENLYAEAEKVPKSGRFHSQVFLAPLLARFGTTPRAARSQLLQMHQDGTITLARADLVDAMDPELVRLSAIEGPGGHYMFHLFDPSNGG